MQQASALEKLRTYRDWWEHYKAFAEFTRRFFVFHDKHVARVRRPMH